jgi:hypothetical protein
MNRHSEIVTAGAVSIETFVDGDGPDVVVLPSYGRDGGDDFEPFTAALVSAGYRVLRPQPRGIGKSIGPMSGVVFDGQPRAVPRAARRGRRRGDRLPGRFAPYLRRRRSSHVNRPDHARRPPAAQRPRFVVS